MSELKRFYIKQHLLVGTFFVIFGIPFPTINATGNTGCSGVNEKKSKCGKTLMRLEHFDFMLL